jgi:hypothetical protein
MYTNEVHRIYLCIVTKMDAQSHHYIILCNHVTSGYVECTAIICIVID